MRLANSPSPSPSPVRSLQQSEGLQHHRSGSWASINVVDTTTNEKVLSRSCNLRSSSLIGNVDDGTHSGSSTAGSYTSSHVDDIHRVQSNPIAYNRTKASGLSPRTGGSSVNSPRSSSSSISPRPNISRNSPGSVRRGGGDSEGSQDYFTTHLTAHVSPPRTGSLRMSSSLGHLAPHQRSRRRRQEQEERGAHLPASSSSPSRRVTIGEELTDVQVLVIVVSDSVLCCVVLCLRIMVQAWCVVPQVIDMVCLLRTSLLWIGWLLCALKNV